MSRSLTCQTPIALLCLVVSAWQIPKREGARDSADDSQRLPKLRELDFLGTGILCVCMTSLILLLNQQVIPSSADFPVLSVLLPSFIGTGILFILIETFWAKYPIVPPNVFRVPAVGWIFFLQVLILTQMGSVGFNHYRIQISR